MRQTRIRDARTPRQNAVEDGEKKVPEQSERFNDCRGKAVS